MNFLRWLHGQQSRNDAVGELADLLVGWAARPALIVAGPSDILEAHEYVAWFLAWSGADTRECQLLFSSTMDRARYEWRLEMTGQRAHTPSQAAAVSR